MTIPETFDTAAAADLPTPGDGGGAYGVEAMLAAERSGLARLSPRAAVAAMRYGAPLVDIRPEYQRRADSDIPAAIVIERNHLEWRLDPLSRWRVPEATGHDIRWILICDEGYSSPLAAASLHRLGLRAATDVAGGFQRWRAQGCPVTRGDRPAVPRVARHGRRVRPPGPGRH